MRRASQKLLRPENRPGPKGEAGGEAEPEHRK